ncbi:MAG: TonB-dependent receptor [Acidobacteria bacterium]|nr:TonB-dependent receptor [Acidobacteriota bacterium]
MERFIVSILFLCIPMMLFAQILSETGRVMGVLKDQSGAVVQGGKIEIKNLDSGLTISTVTDQQGQYAFDSVPVGRYQVSAASTGFETSVRSDITITAGQETTVDVSLNISKTETLVEVTATAISSEAVVPERTRTSDVASLLDGVAGVSLYGGGGVSSLPVIHGMADDRVNVLVNGMSIQPACVNHMNPPLSYVDPANVDSVSVMAGITPVSNGGDSIGGTVTLESVSPEFAKPGQGVLTHGSISAFHRSNGIVNGGNASVSAATENFSVAYTGSYVNANNYKNGGDVIVKSTFYEATNHAVQLAARRGSSLITIDLGFRYIPQQGFVNARMDATSNNAKFANLRYDGAFGWGRLDARAYYEHTRHGMNILRDKIPGMNMPMNTRGTNSGYSVKAEILLSPHDTLRVGNEFRRFLLDDWWPPVRATVSSMGPDTLWNVRGGKRDWFGTYAEWETKRGKGWTALLGVRSDVVRMSTGNVAGYNMSTTTTGSAAYYADAMEFNSRDHKRLDSNFDLNALVRYEPDSTSSYDFGYARKTRSPNLYERYLWVKRSSMSVQMNGWFSDGNGYTGNLDLRPEVANTLSATAGWHDAARKNWELKITPYYTRVQDYIDVDRCPVIADGSSGCTAARFAATTGFVTLQFANHDARLYGVDGSGRLPLGGATKLGDFALSGVLGYVRGENLDTGDNLYHIMPLNAKLTLEHQRGNWSSAFDFEAVDANENVQAVRNELRTAGYALLNLQTSYQWHLTDRASLRLDAGIDNLGNRNYVLPLGGRYWVGDKTGSSSVPGMGRSFYGGLTFKF